jgi:Tfp pilus assembly protein PilF
MERLEEARETLHQALLHSPEDAEAHAAMALVCHRRGDHEGAMHHIREALTEDPDNTDLKDLLQVFWPDDESDPG